MRISESENSLLGQADEQYVDFCLSDDFFPFKFMFGATYAIIDGECYIGSKFANFRLRIYTRNLFKKRLRDKIKHAFVTFLRFIKNDLSSLKTPCARKRLHDNLSRYIETLDIECDVERFGKDCIVYYDSDGRPYTRIKVVSLTCVAY